MRMSAAVCRCEYRTHRPLGYQHRGWQHGNERGGFGSTLFGRVAQRRQHLAVNQTQRNIGGSSPSSPTETMSRRIHQEMRKIVFSAFIAQRRMRPATDRKIGGSNPSEGTVQRFGGVAPVKLLDQGS